MHSAKIINRFKSEGITHALVTFIPKTTVKCNPPYVAGKRDRCWIAYYQAPKTKAEFSDKLGMEII